MSAAVYEKMNIGPDADGVEEKLTLYFVISASAVDGGLTSGVGAAGFSLSDMMVVGFQLQSFPCPF